jgi:histidinol-phosphate aminotransferase
VPVSPRREVLELPLVAHGAISDAELEQCNGRVVDFSVNSNPLGPSPLAAEALAAVDISRYPDPQSLALREALAAINGVQAESVAVGNGSAEIIWLLALAYLRTGDSTLIIGPTFGEYERACRMMGAAVMTLNARQDEGFAPPLGEAAAWVRARRHRLVFLCNPNNPTGVYLRREDIVPLLDAGSGTLWVIDEAYLPFVEEPESLVDLIGAGNLILLRSMTKDWALAGLRLGYALAIPEVVSVLERARPPWSVNSMAQAAGLASLGDAGHRESSLQAVVEGRRFLSERLAILGLGVHPSEANFLLLKMPSMPGLEKAADWRARLLRHGICVRDCASFGLPNHIRIGIRTIPECRLLVDALVEVIAGG